MNRNLDLIDQALDGIAYAPGVLSVAQGANDESRCRTIIFTEPGDIVVPGNEKVYHIIKATPFIGDCFVKTNDGRLSKQIFSSPEKEFEVVFVKTNGISALNEQDGAVRYFSSEDTAQTNISENDMFATFIYAIPDGEGWSERIHIDALVDFPEDIAPYITIVNLTNRFLTVEVSDPIRQYYPSGSITVEFPLFPRDHDEQGSVSTLKLVGKHDSVYGWYWVPLLI